MATATANDEDSFIILGSTPGTSLDIKYTGMVNGSDVSIDKAQLEEALKELSSDAGMALKAQFQIGDNPSPASMMIASTIVSEDKSTEELQKKFGEIIDENVLLKETLKQNNDSLKEQFMMIASCQEDMLKTHQLHKEKFDETKSLVERLRHENKKLKTDIAKLLEDGGAGGPTSGAGDKPSSGVYEFVTSPDEDTINKLTAQLDLVEKQRRQVIEENEKLIWQKESLERIVDASSKEREDLKTKINKNEARHTSRECQLVIKVNQLQADLVEMEQNLSLCSSNANSEDIKKRDSVIQRLEKDISTLQSELKQAKLKILDLENIKLEYTRQKCATSETVKIYKEQILDLQTRLKEAQTTVFQPVRFSISTEMDNSSSEFASLTSNVKLYDRTLKHLSELLDSITHGTSDNIMKTMDLILKTQEYKVERSGVEQLRLGITEIKQNLEKQHSEALHNIGQIRGTLSIFEGIFKDFKEVLKKGLAKTETPVSHGNEALTSALLTRTHELQAAESEITKLRAQLAVLQKDRDDIDLLKAQIDIYKTDFEAERASREKMASEKESALTDLRNTQKRNQELVKQLEEVKKLNPSLYTSIVSKSPQKVRVTSQQSPATSTTVTNGTNNSVGNLAKKKKKCTEGTLDASKLHEGTPPPIRFTCPVCDKPFRTLKMLQDHVYKCPKCMRFSSDQYRAMEEHFDFCLDDF